MLKQSITYTDFNGTERTEDLYFNLTEAELIDIQVNSQNGIEKDLQDAIDGRDIREILAFIKMLVHKSYGVKSEDGRHFRKSEAITEDFVNSALYSDLLLELFKDEGEKGVKFITGLMPKDLIQRATTAMKGDDGTPPLKPTAREMFQERRNAQRVPEATTEIFREGQTAPPSMTEPEDDQSDREAFELWKAQQKQSGTDETNHISRPPHESGPGYQQN